MEHTLENILLSTSVTIKKYRQFEEDMDRSKIADFIRERFTERYITPLSGNFRKKHGFCTMAINCLMVEVLESFRQGWPDTINKSEKAFKSFFRRCSEHDSGLKVFSGHAKDFYLGVRCGILHQAETTKGWRILRKGPLFDPAKKQINATKFQNELGAYLQSYCDELKCADWDDTVWQNLRTKMKAIIKNCKI